MNLTLIDNSEETSTIRINLVAVTTLNMETMKAQSLPATEQSIAQAIHDLTLCNITKTQIALEPAVFAEVAPANMSAQRELRLAVLMKDTVNGSKSHFTIPGPDWPNIGITGTDLVDQTNAAWVELKTRLELYARSDDGNPIVVTGGRLVGRRG
jgi:hypothetical protein